MNNDLQYAGMTLDRCDALRRDSSAMEQLWQDEQTLIVPLCQSKNLFKIAVDLVAGGTAGGEAVLGGQIPQALMLKRADSNAAIRTILERATHPVFLGQQAGISYFAVEIGEADKDAFCDSLQAQFIDLRHIGAVLPGDIAALLAYARGLLFWRQQHQFCSRCGHELTVSHGGHVLICSDSACGRETYPRTDPAVIMLVERTGPDGVQQCLLGCNAVGESSASHET